MLALAVMEEKYMYSSQQDEWELVSMKAEMWLQAPPLPPATPMYTLDNLKHAAKKCRPNKSVIDLHVSPLSSQLHHHTMSCIV